MLLLKEGEASPIQIAKQVGCAVAYVNIVKKEFFRSQKQ